jgi:hypothetical protein
MVTNELRELLASAGFTEEQVNSIITILSEHMEENPKAWRDHVAVADLEG